MAYTVAECYTPSINTNNRVASVARAAGYADWADIVDGASKSMSDAIDAARLVDDLRSIEMSGSILIDQIVIRKFNKARARVLDAMN